MEATKQTKMTKEDLHLSWKDKLNIIRDNRYFLMLFPIVMLAVMILIFGVATAGRFFKLSVMKGILSQAIIIGTCATGVAFIYSNGNLDISIGAVLGLAGIVTKGFDQLQILARPGAGDLEEHASTITRHKYMSIWHETFATCHYKTFAENRPETRMAVLPPSQNSPFLPSNCRTRVNSAKSTCA